jgi:hypothetical protein
MFGGPRFAAVSQHSKTKKPRHRPGLFGRCKSHQNWRADGIKTGAPTENAASSAAYEL